MTAKQKHLDLKSRYVIEHSLDSSMSFKAIAREPGSAPPVSVECAWLPCAFLHLFECSNRTGGVE